MPTGPYDATDRKCLDNYTLVFGYFFGAMHVLELYKDKKKQGIY